jgi:hypothetical protein
MKYSKLIIYSSAFLISLAGIAGGNFANAGYKTIAGNYEGGGEIPSDDGAEQSGGGGEHYDGDGHPPEDHYPPTSAPPAYPDPIYGCEIMDYDGVVSRTCESSASGPYQCFADIVKSHSTQERIWGKTCVSNVSECLWDGLSRVEPCYSY